MINFEDEFWELADKMNSALVVFYRAGEPGWTVNNSEAKFIIAINHNISWEKKLFVLCHEIGHIFYIDVVGDFMIEYTHDETTAHQRAKKILSKIDEELFEEYVDYFNSQKKVV